jgi:hypothetical protein
VIDRQDRLLALLWKEALDMSHLRRKLSTLRWAAEQCKKTRSEARFAPYAQLHSRRQTIDKSLRDSKNERVAASVYCRTIMRSQGGQVELMAQGTSRYSMVLPPRGAKKKKKITCPSGSRLETLGEYIGQEK